MLTLILLSSGSLSAIAQNRSGDDLQKQNSIHKKGDTTLAYLINKISSQSIQQISFRESLSPTEFMNNIRLNKAAELISTEDVTRRQMSHPIGFMSNHTLQNGSVKIRSITKRIRKLNQVADEIILSLIDCYTFPTT